MVGMTRCTIRKIHDKRPILVLGDLEPSLSFQINLTFGETEFFRIAYPEEEAIFVALETGSIELKSRSFKSYQLRPGEKAVYNKASGRCEVLRSHDVKMYSAWRRNVLVFKSAPLSDVMKTLARTDFYLTPFFLE